MPPKHPPHQVARALAAGECELPEAIGRYTVREELGRGGMARVYRVHDASTDRELALKQLVPPPEPKRARSAALLFEREFHILAQLAHPRVIRVFDFGIEADAPYYTMELLDGGDLRERAPLPYRTACELVLDVCSSLSLLHARRLVHRDVSPRNVRCTRDGHAKLIDFGAMAPMGSSGQVVGTAPFVAPEALYGSMLDGRTDLFSLGATLYYALTGRLAYPARDFTQLRQAWVDKPTPPSTFRPEIPAALDQLVLSMLSLEPALRPRSAFEVMQRLSTLADVRGEEAPSVSQAYLVTPQLVGRDAPLSSLRGCLDRAQRGSGSALLFAAASGLGRSRMLDACAIEAKMRGATVIRASGTAKSGDDLAAARALAEELFAALPDLAPSAARVAGVYDMLFERAASSASGEPLAAPKLKSFARSPLEQRALSRAIRKWFVEVSRARMLVILADDVERCDEPTVALLARVAERASNSALVLVASSEQRASEGSVGVQALASRAESQGLAPLSLEQTEVLLGSVFGDVPNLALVSSRIHGVAHGNPRAIMAAAQHLIDRGFVRYEAGNFSLPAELGPGVLPASDAEARSLRAALLSPLARTLAEALALASVRSFTREDFSVLAGLEATHVDAALEELLARQIVISDDEGGYVLEHEATAEVLTRELAEPERVRHHARLAELFERTRRSELATARHFLFAGEAERGLAKLMPVLLRSQERAELSSESGLGMPEIAELLTRALEHACALPRPPREQHELRHWATLVSVAADQSLYWCAAPAWLTQLAQDSGLDDYRALAEIEDRGARLKAALGRAAKRYAETPEALRVYPPDQAIRRLIYYVAISIAIGTRTQDAALVHTLPSVIEPFAPLSPLLAAIWQNAVATRELSCLRQLERACARWSKVYEQLADATGSDPGLIRSIRHAIAYGVGTGEAMMGLANATRWAEILDVEPLQQVNAMYLRKVVRLQQGDLEGAEGYRKQAELLALSARMPQMFTSMLTLELMTHYAAWDLTGVKQIAEKIAPLAQRSRGWIAQHELASGHYRRLRGDLEGALEAYARSLALSTPTEADPYRSITAWPMAAAAYVETLIDLRREAEAQSFALETLAECERRELGVAAHDLVRALALAEAKLGEHARAIARLDALIEAQRALGVSGLSLGASYEARARVSLLQNDRERVEHYAKLTAEQYRHGHGSTLGARYERLMDEARSAGVVVLPELSPFRATIFGSTEMSERSRTAVTAARSMTAAVDANDRAERALALLCDANGSPGGHLYIARAGELARAASHAIADPEPELGRAALAFFREMTDEEELDTQLVEEGFDEPAREWTDSAGRRFRPLLVTGRVRGSTVHAGVALLMVNDELDSMEVLVELAAELTPYLVADGADDV